MTHLLTMTSQSEAKSSFSTRRHHCWSSESCSKPLPECDQSTESETSDSSGDVTWQFQCEFPIHLCLIYLTSFLDQSSTLSCFTVVTIGRWLIWQHFSLHSVGAVFTSSESTANKVQWQKYYLLRINTFLWMLQSWTSPLKHISINNDRNQHFICIETRFWDNIHLRMNRSYVKN